MDTRITNNTTLVTGRSGDAGATGGGVYSLGAGSQPVTISDSVISDNATIATSTDGSAYVLGAGILNDGRLVLDNDEIANNVGIVRPPSGFAHGGGIWSGSIYNEGPIKLTLETSSVTGDRLRGSPGISLEGGGMFTSFPVAIRSSDIAHNVPGRSRPTSAGSSRGGCCRRPDVSPRQTTLMASCTDCRFAGTPLPLIAPQTNQNVAAADSSA